MPTLHIRKETVKNIVSSVLTPDMVKEKINFDHIKSLILDTMSDSTLENVAELMLKGEPYILIYPGDIVKTISPNYHEGSEYEKDILMDKDLLSKEGMVYAKVIGDSNWSTSAGYNPLYTNLKVQYIYHDENSDIKYKEDTISPFELIKIKGKELKLVENQLNKTQDAKIITGTDQITL